MCGIMAYLGLQNGVDTLLDGLQRLEYRGYDSSGLAIIGDDGSLCVLKRNGKIRSLIECLKAGALKLKEISYIHAEGYAAGEMKHGPIALIDREMPVVVLIQKGALREKILSNLEEVRARDARVSALVQGVPDRAIASGEHQLVLPDVSELPAPIVFTVPLQLLAYYTAVQRGTDVDQPRNLAKSVTVE